MTGDLDCLIVRQPYASLIAYGLKRWEFRGYDTKKTGRIGLAASNTAPLETRSKELNSILHTLPLGVVLATAELSDSFFVTSSDLKKFISEPVVVNLHGHLVKTLGEPIGEPIEDVLAATANPRWESFCWLLENVNLLQNPIPFKRLSRSTWVSVEA